MNIMISGGTGMVGSELGKALVAKGHKVFILTRSPEKANLTCPFPQTAISYDELDSHPILPQLDGIINLAGAGLFDKRWNKSYKETIYNSRIKTTQHLVTLANEKCKKLSAFVSTSAVGIYGNAGDEVLTEEARHSFHFLGKVCQDWEAPLSILRKDIRDVVLRVGIVLSEKGGALQEMVNPIQAGVGGALSNGEQYMSWIDIDDLVNMYIYAVENSIQGTFNAVAPNPEKNKQITKAIANHLETSTLMNVPYFALRMAMGEMARYIVENQNASSVKIQNKGFQFQYKRVTESIEKRVPKLKGMQRRKIFEQWVPEPKETLFPFFSDAHNLETITPPSLQFKVLDSSTDPIEEGTIINYKLKIDGIPMKWKTKIMKWEPPHQFVDNQEKGPYRKWYHLHKFTDLGGGTLLTDRIDFELPLGALGYALASWKVLKDVHKIFDYRQKVIHEKYCSQSTPSVDKKASGAT